MWWTRNTDMSSIGPSFIPRQIVILQVMAEYNTWCETHLDEVAKTHANSRHPKQKDKRIINDVMERMSTDRPDLLMTLLNNDDLNFALDALIGLARFGAVTGRSKMPVTSAQYPASRPCAGCT